MASSTSTTSGDERPGAAPWVPPAGAGAPPPQAHAEWAASLQTYYAAGVHPYAWPAAAQQHMMVAAAAAAASAGARPPYGGPVPFPLYHPAYYAHGPMMAGAVPFPAGEAVSTSEGNSKRKSYGEGSSGSNRRSEESSGNRDASTDQKISVLPYVKRRKSSIANAEGESSQVATTQDAAPALTIAAKGRSASKLSVSTPERATHSNATPNLNIGIDIWSSSPAKAETSGQGEVSAGAPSQHVGALSQMQDERELKRERRKQSNRESARRSRLRKQQECEELAQKVTELTSVNGALRSELDQLKKACEDMQTENSQLMGEMGHSEAPSVLTTLSIQVDTSKAHQGNNGHLHNKDNNDSKG